MKDYSLRDEKSRLIQATATSLHEHITELFDNGYEQGYADAKAELGQNAINLAHEESDRAYQQGLADAWEAAKKIRLNTGLSPQELMQIFGKAVSAEIFEENTASEAVTKIKEYENKQKHDAEIKVGDEVYRLDANHPRVVTSIFDDSGRMWALQISENGKWAVDDIEDIHKTGRHFPQIAEVLAEMRGDKE